MIAEEAGLAQILEREYGLVAPKLTRVGGENINFLVETDGPARYVFKRWSTHPVDAWPDLDRALAEHITRSGVRVAVPRLVPTRNGGWLTNGSALFTFVDGTPWRRAVRTAALREHLGRTLAEIDIALLDIELDAARHTHAWDLTKASRHWPKVSLIEDRRERRQIDALFQLWAAEAAPHLADLPRSIIHADANEDNVLVDGERVVGLLDFGDALENPTVCELAIAATYAMLDEADPLGAAADVVAGYESVRQLSALEREVIFPLMCGRLAMSVVIATERRRIDPARHDWFVSQAAAGHAIEAILATTPGAARAQILRESGEPASIAASRLADRQRLMSPALSVSYAQPIAMDRGVGQYLIDADGKPYLDLVNNVCHVGHCHPHVVSAVSRQMARLNTNTRYLYDELTQYAERLTRTLPSPLEVCFFVNSGSEANELALRLARAHTKNNDVLVVDGAYHGNTTTLVAMSPYKFMGPGGSGKAQPWVHVVPMPDGYRGSRRGFSRGVGVAYGDDVGSVIREAGGKIAAFFVEPILSCGGQIVPPPGFLETAFAHVRRSGGVCVADEVQTGFGRVGSSFWAFQREPVVPDIVVMGKPIGNGHPIGAVVTTRAIAASFNNGMEFFSTFGGNPVSCAAGMAVLDVIEREQLQERALRLGDRLIASLRELQDRHSLIGDVRGSGLFAGIELVRDRTTLEPAASEASTLVNRLKDRGLLLSTDGPLHNVIKIKPPLVLTEHDVDMFIRALDDELSVVSC